MWNAQREASARPIRTRLVRKTTSKSLTIVITPYSWTNGRDSSQAFRSRDGIERSYTQTGGSSTSSGQPRAFLTSSFHFISCHHFSLFYTLAHTPLHHVSYCQYSMYVSIYLRISCTLLLPTIQSQLKLISTKATVCDWLYIWLG